MKGKIVWLNGRVVSCMLLLLLSTVSCTFTFNSGKGSFSSVTVSEFADFIDNPGVQLVDVRTPEEYAAGNIPGSINIDVKNGHEELATKLDPERPVALYCRSGRRSEQAGWVLEKCFFKKVVDLKGGYNAWVEYHSNNN